MLILSASMGAGHDGAAREIARRLAGAGHDASVRDFLDAGPLRIGSALKSGYEFELRHVPSAYDATYRFWHRVPWLCGAVAWLVCVLTRRRVLRWVRDHEADVVVSTYPLATLALGRLRRLGRLQVPAVNFITDFGVHPLWVHRGIDLNLAVHDGPAQTAAARTGRPSIACGPVVDARFEPTAEQPARRRATREQLGLRPDDRAVLVVAGSWGVGDIADTLRAVAADGRFVPIVVCGRDTGLQSRVEQLAAQGGWKAVVLGWTDRMPELMAAADALVENAGGLTSFEAMRAGLPVVSFNPIAGHGRDNTAAMAAAGVSRLAGDPPTLRRALDELTAAGPARAAQVASGAAMFRTDGSALAVSAAAAYRPARTPVGVAARSAATLCALAALAWGVLTTGVGVAAAAGAGVAHPRAGAGRVAYVGARLDSEELADPSVMARVEALHLTVVVDQVTTEESPAAVMALVRKGIDVADGGAGAQYDASGSLERPAPWSRAHGDVEAGATLARLIGRPVRVFAPGRRITAFDLLDCRDAHLSVVVPNAELTAADLDRPVAPGAFRLHQIYLLNGLGSSPEAMAALLDQTGTALVASGLQAAPLADLR